MDDFKNRLTFYRKTIIELTGCAREDARFVEDVMRSENGGVLDHLPRAKFKREALKALSQVPLMRAEFPGWDPA
jgi:hypothetical protein